ncbi:MAG: hypothetical protein IK012_09560 [Fibrobacter sp.]|uniref:S8 family serine peptidase n=1 Tax=Fibrobacter sp. TaxID=35828 RepID=UPI0025BD72CF|nr:S8 family serine peptidase [Fibrobacter sp.]MBR4785480.1 hypothetical protein [Fibrobacter sp.]
MKKKITVCVALGCAAAFAATNYDLLGRNGSKMNSPMVYKNVDYHKVKKNEQQELASPQGKKALMRSPTGLNGPIAISGVFDTEGLAYGRDGSPYCFSLKRYYSDQSLESIDASVNAYLDMANSVFIPVNMAKNVTPANLFSGSTPISYVTHYDVSEQYDGSAFAPTSYWDVEFDNLPNSAGLKRGDISWWFDANYNQCQECGDVGLYMDIGAKPVRLDPSKTLQYALYESNPSFVPNPEREVISSKAYSILRETTKNTAIYITGQLPEGPKYKNPQVYVGLHNRKDDSGMSQEAATYYTAEARDLDNYIYANRTVDVVAAGNRRIRNNLGQLTPQGHAANAITVGAVDAANGQIASYTSNKSNYCAMGIGHCSNGQYTIEGSSKPEIFNYSEFKMPGDMKRTYNHWYSNNSHNPSPNYDGTEAAATYTANMVAGLLRVNPFYRWHPEVVKALLLNAGEININNPYYLYDFTPVTTKIPSYKSTVFNRFHHGEYFHDSRYWIGDWPRLSTHIVAMKSELRFSVKRPSNKHNFSAAIAWLSSGNDIASIGMLPQNFDLYVYDNNSSDVNNIDINNYRAISNSERNAFEKVTFWSNAQYLTFRIVLKSEHTRTENPRQAVLGFDLAAAN